MKLPKYFGAVIVALFIIISVRLIETGITTDNMKGALFSIFHVGVVSAGAYFLIRKNQAN